MACQQAQRRGSKTHQLDYYYYAKAVVVNNTVAILIVSASGRAIVYPSRCVEVRH